MKEWFIMSWLSNLIKKLIGEDHSKLNIKETNESTSIYEERKPSNRESLKSEVNAKVIYQYPKGNFRFPVIPDDEIEKKRRRSRQYHVKEKQIRKSASQNDSYNKKDFNPNPRGFKPTEIPSPIYGFGPRHNSENIYERLRNVNEPIELYNQKESHSHQPIETKINNNYDSYEENELEIVQQINDTQVADDQEFEATTENQYEKSVDFDELKEVEIENQEEYKSSNVQEEAKKDRELESNLNYQDTEIKGSNTTIINDSITEQDEQKTVQNTTEIKKEEFDLKKNTSPLHTNEKRKTTIPYNVLMFSRDKRKLKQREESYQYPSLSLLKEPPTEQLEDKEWIKEQSDLLDLTLKNFNVRAKVVNVTQGPSVTRLEVQPEPGVKVSKITNLTDDIKLSLSARDIRIEAPIPGKNTIGIEVPNKKSKMVLIKEIIHSSAFHRNTSPLTVALGLDISGQPIVTDIKKMPHGLIAGATGSGKSVCINTILVSLLYKASPQDVKLLLIDPKMVELAPYNDIPHLVSPVITDVKAATASLKWAVEEMERRYELFAHTGVRDIEKYNENVKRYNQGEKLPYIVIVIDELADLMMVAPGDVEEAICRIAQKARACGIHLLIATQRPSVDVITGLIKANIPTRIAFSVSSQVDSRTIIDTAGAERLLGKGDMLFLENGSSKPLRVQGNFVSDEEIERVVEHVRKQGKPQYLFKQEELLKKATVQSEEDELFYEACEFVIEQGGASTSSLQRRFRIGYNRAARLMDLMEQQGIISEPRGSKPRDVLVTEEEIEALKESGSNL